MALRIVGGRHRGRALAGPAPDDRALRPTADRARQALFDVLVHGGFGADGGAVLEGATVLDAFCGTGALAFEALSRGAARAVLMDRAPAARALARRNAETLGEAARVTILGCDATAPPAAPAAADLCFLDPPYGAGLVAPALAALARRGWIGPATLCVIETDRDTPPPAGLEILDDRRHGAARLVIGRPAATG